MVIPIALVQIPAIGSVEALVVVVGSGAQVPEVETNGDKDQKPKEGHIPIAMPVLLHPGCGISE
jgi:hypothetical protein